MLPREIAGISPKDTPDIATLSLGEARPNLRFVCVDVETYEFNHSLVTEVGFAELDTSQLKGMPQGDSFQNWFGLIRASHYIVKENSWARNRVHVEGNQMNFNFGSSQMVPLATLHTIIVKTLGRESPRNTRKSPEDSEATPIVLVGHDIQADILHLQKISYDARKVAGIVDIVDTQNIFQHWQCKKDSSSLGRVLEALKIPNRYLHNAGNDAVYTMQAMLMIAAKARQESFERSIGRKT